jgi:hypothetical protein
MAGANELDHENLIRVPNRQQFDLETDLRKRALSALVA